MTVSTSGDRGTAGVLGDERIRDPRVKARLMSAQDAAALIAPGSRVGMSGFTGSGYPKVVPGALAARITEARAAGNDFQISLWTGASTAPELDGLLAEADGIGVRMPYQSDRVSRARINEGRMEYVDLHLSHMAQMVWEGYFGPLDVAVVEVAGVTEDGELIPSTSVGNNKTWLDLAEMVILEVNAWEPIGLDGMHDIYYGTALPPHRRPVQILRAADRIGQPHLRCEVEKIVGVVATDQPDVAAAFKPPDETSNEIAGHVVEYLTHEVGRGRLPPTLLPIQSGVGNVANAVLRDLQEWKHRPLTAYTEVIQDGMLSLLQSGVMSVASATSFSLSESAMQHLRDNISDYHDRVVLRPQEISNHPEVVRRLGCLAMNGMVEADIYANVNSTHVMASSILNGIGGSGDFARNSYMSMFVSPSVAKGGAISCIVPMVSHVDHTEHDVHVIVTEQGLADVRGLAPRRRARKVIENCAHPDYRDALLDYLERAEAGPGGKHTPHLLAEALAWHRRYLDSGSMRGG